jgi:NodT family efflux transporter outer membrane factor (OMF) lipoprotein
VWGRISSQVAAGEAQYEAAIADFEYARQSLAAQVAKSWFLATEVQMQRELAEMTLALKTRTLELVQAQSDSGRATRQDLALARADVATAADTVAQAESSYEQAVRALEVILGRYPGAELEVPHDLIEMPAPPAAGLPSQLLERRPDLLAAELRIAAAFEQLQSDDAARLPRFALTTEVGAGTADLSDFSDTTNPFWSLGANIVAPIFDGGLREAQVAISEANQEAALAAYAGAALVAFQEVENALRNEAILQRRETLLLSAVEDNAEATRLARTQYEVGAIALLSVLQIQQREIGSRAALISIRNARLTQRVNLHLALGGSFEQIER